MTTREVLKSLTREEGIAFFNSKKTEKEVYETLVKKGLTDPFDTFIEESKKLFAENVSKMSKEEIMAQMEGAELTEEQLEMISGGKDDEEEDDLVTYSLIGEGVILATLSAFALSSL